MATQQLPHSFIAEPPPDCAGAFDAIYRKEFPRLRAIAQRLLSRERAGHTLQATALIHESFLKLRGMRGRIESEEHLFHLCARAMKQALIDHARVRGKWSRVGAESLPELFFAMGRAELDGDLALDLKVTWERLRALDRNAAQAIWFRHSEGRTIDETATCLGRTPARVRADCEFALKWMADQLNKRS